MTAAAADGRHARRSARCWLHLERFDRRRDPAELDAALADFAELPPGFGDRPRLAAALVSARLRSGTFDEQRIDETAKLVATADEGPQPPEWGAPRAAVRAMWLARSVQIGRPGVDDEEALAEIERLTSVVNGVEPYATAVKSARIGVEQQVAARTHDIGRQQKLVAETAQLAAAQAADTPQHVRGRILAIMGEAQAAHARGDMTTALAKLDEAAALRDQLPPGDTLRGALDEALSSVSTMRHVVDRSTVPPPGFAEQTLAGPLAELRTRVARTDLSPAQRAMNLCELASAEMALAESDHQLPHLADAVDHLRAAVDLAPEADHSRPFYLMTLAGALLRHYEISNRGGFGVRRDLDDAVAVAEQGKVALGGPAHPMWSTLGQILADAHRFAGRPALARAAGQDGLRGNLWSVLLQSDTAAATAAVRDAAAEAVALARRCLDEKDAAGAATALDAGRGLMLLSALRFGNTGARLDALGETELAARWRAEAGPHGDQATVELRTKVVTALLGHRAALQGRPVTLDPPDVHELRAALQRTGTDALVYLVPADDNGSGLAVVVPSRGEPSWCPLPDLDPRVEVVERYLAATAVQDARDIAEPGRKIRDITAEPPETGLSAAVNALSGWAWTAAVEGLLNHLAHHHGRPLGRPTRLAFVPMGVLGRIPWHAAAHTVDGRRRYALESVVFSYAVSARLFCDLAFTAPIPRTRAGLVIGDPDTHGRASVLYGARAEAVAIRQAFYPNATYLGRADGPTRAAGPGTVAEVTTWLADERPDAGAVLHAACHGTVRPGTGAKPTSYLELACGQLTAEDLVRTLATRPARRLALAVLAACNSGVPGRGYDEAFSIATAFLAAGTRSVVSSLWKVPDTATSVLMFLFHDRLRELEPVDALRDAQLWMLRPDREPPPEAMPPELQKRLARADPSDIVAWAGFTHAG